MITLGRTHNNIDTEIAYACPTVIVYFGRVGLRILPVFLFKQDLESPTTLLANPTKELILAT